ncbi:hypothetical protein ElP_26700 [Tautonia plasticadhaerens]|uniref:Uncharacterized protein n=1 Tax=Tautonia plasticadhaerens TaxID=2527974 RepID=A0A518H1R1_9BACT|nr:hypothetical protein ElP_26700 [Tautonia plasticadhaerens]
MNLNDGNERVGGSARRPSGSAVAEFLRPAIDREGAEG